VKQRLVILKLHLYLVTWDLITLVHSRVIEIAKKINESKQKSKKNENEKESYYVAGYVAILSFLWDVQCQWVRILIDGILSGDILFNSSNFDWKICHGVDSTHSPGFSYCLLARLGIVHSACFLS